MKALRAAFLSIFLGAFSLCAFSQGILVGAIAANETGKSLIGKAKAAASDLIVQAEQTGNALVGRFGNELNLAVSALEATSNRTLSRAFTELDGDLRSTFEQLGRIEQSGLSAINRAYEEKDAAVVDVANIFSRILPNAVFIQQIRGTAFVEGISIYEMSVAGVGLGPGDSKTRATVELYINGARVNPERVDNTKSNRTSFLIPSNVLEPLFKSNAVSFVKATVRLSHSRKGLFGWGKSQIVETPVTLALFPRFIGEVEVHIEEPEFLWLPAPSMTDTWESKDCGENRCKRNPDRKTVVIKVDGGNSPLVGNKRIASIHKRCTPLWGPEACAWTRVETELVNAPKTQAQWTLSHDGERVRWDFEAKVEEFKSSGRTITSKKSLRLQYGANIEFDFPTSAAYYRVTGRTLTGRPIHFVRGQADETGTLQEAVKEFQITPEVRRAVFRLKQPTS